MSLCFAPFPQRPQTHTSKQGESPDAGGSERQRFRKPTGEPGTLKAPQGGLITYVPWACFFMGKVKVLGGII